MSLIARTSKGVEVFGSGSGRGRLHRGCPDLRATAVWQEVEKGYRWQGVRVREAYLRVNGGTASDFDAEVKGEVGSRGFQQEATIIIHDDVQFILLTSRLVSGRAQGALRPRCMSR